MSAWSEMMAAVADVAADARDDARQGDDGVFLCTATANRFAYRHDCIYHRHHHHPMYHHHLGSCDAAVIARLMLLRLHIIRVIKNDGSEASSTVVPLLVPSKRGRVMPFGFHRPSKGESHALVVSPASISTHCRHATSG